MDSNVDCLKNAETQVRWWFSHVNKSLGHKKSYFELRMKGSDGFVDQFWANNPEDVMKKLYELKSSKFDGNVWFGLQPRKNKGGKNDDVEALMFYGNDYDALNKDSKTGTPEEDYIDILRWGKYELESILKASNGGKQPYFVIGTGGGVQGYYPHKPIVPTPENIEMHAKKTMKLGQQILEQIPHYNLIIDEVKDAARVLRLVDFRNPRGGRMAEILEYAETELETTPSDVVIERDIKSPVLEIALKKRIGKHRRYAYFVHLVGLMASSKWSSENAKAALVKFNKEQCEEPASDYYIDNAMSSYDRWIKSNRVITAIDFTEIDVEGWLLSMAEFDTIQEAERYLLGKLKVMPKKGAEKQIELLMAKYYTYVIPRIILKAYPAKTSQPDDKILVYSDGIWKESESSIRMFMEANNDLVCSKLVLTSKRKDEAISQIKDRTTVSIHDFDNAPAYLLPLQNGVLDLRTLTLRPYTPDDMFTKKLAVSYDPEAKCERFDSFLSEVADGNTDVEATKKCLRQLVGYCLWKGYEKQKIFFLVGGGSNGKGVYMKVIERLLGRDNVSSVGTSALTESPFEKAELFGKYANISSELTVGKLKDVDNLKALSGGDQIEAQKKYKNPFTFTNTAKIIIASNQPPNIRDTSIGWWRRVHLIRFLRQFKESEQDTTLVAKMTTKEALSGVLNVAIKELKEWMQDDGSLKDKIHLANEMDVETLQTVYECLEDPAMAFIYDCCYKAEAGDNNPIITKDALFKHYTTYCESRKLPTVSEKSFTMTLKEKVGWISETHTEIGGVDTRCWRDIKVDLKKVDELHNFR